MIEKKMFSVINDNSGYTGGMFQVINDNSSGKQYV